MLHVIGIVFKCIGILLLAILAIVVLLASTVLFVPIRYEAEGKAKGSIDTTEGRLQIHWLFSLFRIRVLYQNGKLRWQARAGWKTFSSGWQRTKEETVKEQPLKKQVSIKQSDALKETKKESGCQAEPIRKQENPPVKKTLEQKKESQVERQPETKTSGKKNLFEKIKKQFQKIRYTVRKICAKIKVLQQKKEKVEAFLLEKTHRSALEKGKEELLRMLRIFKPDVLQVSVRFGFEDPSITGRVLAALAVIYPFFEGNVHITPEFEEKIWIGKAAVKGHIRLNHFVALAIRLLWNQDIRRTVKDGKQLWNSL